MYHSRICPWLLAVLLLVSCSGPATYVRIEGFAQGGTYHVISAPLRGVSETELRARIDTLLNEIDFTLSGYNKGSLLSRINAGEDPPLNDLFVDCFTRSKEIWAESDGAFDPSAAPLFDLWGFGFANKGTVTQAAIDSILAFVGMDLLTLETRDDGIHLVKADPRIKLNFNAIAQGFSADTVAGLLESLGSTDYLVDIGREILCKGKNASGGLWRIGLDRPEDGNMEEGKNLQAVIEISGKGIVTSGNYRKFYVEDGQKYAHTIDPATGRPVTHNLLSATVIADDSTTADAYATWLMVIGTERARELLAARDDIEALLVFDQDGQMQTFQTKNVNSFIP